VYSSGLVISCSGVRIRLIPLSHSLEQESRVTRDAPLLRHDVPDLAGVPMVRCGVRPALRASPVLTALTSSTQTDRSNLHRRQRSCNDAVMVGLYDYGEDPLASVS
jgi:hypothetical protein